MPPKSNSVAQQVASRLIFRCRVCDALTIIDNSRFPELDNFFRECKSCKKIRHRNRCIEILERAENQ